MIPNFLFQYIPLYFYDVVKLYQTVSRNRIISFYKFIAVSSIFRNCQKAVNDRELNVLFFVSILVARSLISLRNVIVL